MVWQSWTVGIFEVGSVDTYQIGLLYVEGTFVEQLTAGTYYFWKNDQKVDVYKADMRKTPMEVQWSGIIDQR